MAVADSPDSGVGIKRTSLSFYLSERYLTWQNNRERRAPTPVNFLNDKYVTGFSQEKVGGGADPSEIRAIGLGGPGAKSLYSEELGLPGSVNFLTDLYQSQFIKNMQVRQTSFKNNALNYVDGVPGFNNTKYSSTIPENRFPPQ
jgi:hypothetical protein